MTCSCVTTTITKTVTVHPDLSTQPIFTGTITNNATTNDFNQNSNATATGITHFWQIYEADDCLNTTMILNENNNPIGLATPGNSANFTALGLDNTKCYIIQHIISYDGACEAEFRKKFYNAESENEGTEAVYYSRVSDEMSRNAAGDKSKTGTVNTQDIVIFPNPSSGEFNVNLKNENAFQYSVYDISGKLILEKSTFNSSAVIDLSNFESGIYSIQVTTERGKKHQQKLSKMD